MPADAETHLRRRHPRWRQRRLRLRPAGGGARALSVALVEKGKLGGTCLHQGCIPTKALLHAAEVADSAREGEQFGVKTTFESVDMTGVNALQGRRRRPALQGPPGPGEGRARSTTSRARAASTARTPSSVGGRRLTGRNVVLATGSYAKSLPGLEIGGRIMTSEQALVLDHVPARVVVLGGGVIGVEFASVFKSLRLRGDDRRGAPPPRRGRGRGHLQAARAALPQAQDRLQDRRAVRRRHPERRRRDRLARGRRDHRGRPAARRRRPRPGHRGPGLRGGRRHPRPRLRAHRRAAAAPTSTGVYAVGDIVPGLQLAHRGFAQGIFVAEEIAGLAPAPIVERGIPRVTYCDPEIASRRPHRGPGAREVRRRRDRTSTTSAATASPRSCSTQGFVKLVREKDGPVVGVHMIGARMGEQVGEAQLIVNWEALP